MVHLGEGIGQLPRGVAVRGGFGLGGVHAWALRVERAAPKEGAQASARETAVMFPCSLLRLKPPTPRFEARNRRSEEHTSELQSPCNLVCRLLLEKKKTILYTATFYSRLAVHL